MKRVAMMLFAAVLLGGCATKAELIVLPSLNGEKRSFDFFDLRPAEQFKTHTRRQERSDLVFYGDDVVIPSRTELLADQLHANFSTELKGKSVTISSFVLSTSQWTNRGGPGYAASGNPIADLVGVAIGSELIAAASRSNELYVSTHIVAKIDEQEISAETRKYVNAKNAAHEIAVHVQTAMNEFMQKVKEMIGGVPVNTGAGIVPAPSIQPEGHKADATKL